MPPSLAMRFRGRVFHERAAIAATAAWPRGSRGDAIRMQGDDTCHMPRVRYVEGGSLPTGPLAHALIPVHTHTTIVSHPAGL